MVEGTFDALRAAAESAPEFVLKLDTDALVIAPFADRIRGAVAAYPDVGIFGVLRPDVHRRPA